MKYSQYYQGRNLFESDLAQSYGYDLSEWDSLPPFEKAEQLNEILGIAGLTTALLGKIGFGAAVGLLGIGVSFRKKLISAGLKRIYLRNLVKNARNFKKGSLEGLKKAIAPLVDAKNKIKEDNGVESWKELPSDKRLEIFNIEKRMEKVLTQYVTRVRQLKNEEVYKKIDNSKRLSDSAKLALKYAWETIATEVETGLLAELMKDKVIETPKVINDLDNRTKKQEDILKKSLEEYERKAKEESKARKEGRSTEGEEEKIYKEGEEYNYKTNNNEDWVIRIKTVKDNGDLIVYNIEYPKKPFSIKKGGDSIKRIGDKAEGLRVGKEYFVEHTKVGGKVKATIESIEDNGKLKFAYNNEKGEEMTVTINKDDFNKIIVKEEEKAKKEKAEVKGKKI